MNLTDNRGQREADNEGLGIKNVASGQTEPQGQVFLSRCYEGREEAGSSSAGPKAGQTPWLRAGDQALAFCIGLRPLSSCLHVPACE